MPTNPCPDPEDPRSVTNQAIVRAVQEALAEGATDDLEGGVPAAEVARRLDIAERYTRARLAHLASAGVLTRVWGRSPEGLRRPRASFVPSDER